jgi:hypothetical protein
MTERGNRDAGQEWIDQEQAVRAERSGTTTADTGARVAQYRLIDRVLREPINEALLQGFAAMVAARAEAATQATVDRTERVIQGALVACLALTTLMGFGPDLVAVLGHVARGAAGERSAAIQWSVAISVCLTLTLLVDIWPRRQPRHGGC